MAYVLLAIGGILAYLDYLGSGNLTAAGSLLKQEMFTNQPPFYKWFGALILVALLGYIPELRPVSSALLVLIILAIVLTHNNGLVAAIKVA